MLFVILICLGAGVALVAAAQRRAPGRADRMEAAGGMLLVVGLVGLGYVLTSRP